MEAFSLSRGATLQIMAPAFPKVGTGSGSVHCSLLTGAGPVPDRFTVPCHQTVPEARGTDPFD